MIEKPVHDQAGLRSPPRDELKEITTSRGLEAPYYQQQGAFHVVEEAELTAAAEVACDSDFDSQEAMRNFQSYLDILREWDEADKEKGERLSAKGVRCD